MQEEAIWTLLTVRMSGVATHPGDDQVLATAVSAQAEYLVTGDKNWQQVATYQGVRVISPRAFLDLLEVFGGES